MNSPEIDELIQASFLVQEQILILTAILQNIQAQIAAASMNGQNIDALIQAYFLILQQILILTAVLQNIQAQIVAASMNVA